MNATPVRQVREVAEAGEVMPQKSTFFYPKVATGLAIHTLDPTRNVAIVGVIASCRGRELAPRAGYAPRRARAPRPQGPRRAPCARAVGAPTAPCRRGHGARCRVALSKANA